MEEHEVLGREDGGRRRGREIDGTGEGFCERWECRWRRAGAEWRAIGEARKWLSDGGGGGGVIGPGVESGSCRCWDRARSRILRRLVLGMVLVMLLLLLMLLP